MKCKQCKKDFDRCDYIAGHGHFCHECILELAWMYLDMGD